MKRIAIPVTDGKLSRHFGACSHYMIFSVDAGKIRSSTIEAPVYTEVDRIPEWVAEKRVTDIITYKINKKVIGLFARHKINIWVGAPDLSPALLVKEYMNGTLISDEQVLATEDFNDRQEAGS